MTWRFAILAQQAEEANIHKSAELSCLPNCKVASIQPVQLAVIPMSYPLSRHVPAATKRLLDKIHFHLPAGSQKNLW